MAVSKIHFNFIFSTNRPTPHSIASWEARKVWFGCVKHFLGSRHEIDTEGYGEGTRRTGASGSRWKNRFLPLANAATLWLLHHRLKRTSFLEPHFAVSPQLQI